MYGSGLMSQADLPRAVGSCLLSPQRYAVSACHTSFLLHLLLAGLATLPPPSFFILSLSYSLPKNMIELIEHCYYPHDHAPYVGFPFPYVHGLVYDTG